MPHRQNRNRLAISPVERDVTTGPGIDRPFPEQWRHVLCRPAGFWMRCEQSDTLPDGRHSPPPGLRVLFNEEVMQAGDIP